MDILNEIWDFIRFILSIINSTLLYVIGMVLVTILIPTAIAIFRGTKDFEVLDNNVILDRIVGKYRFLITLALIFLPLLFWYEKPPPDPYSTPSFLKLIIFIFWVCGIFRMINILKNSYKWMKGEKFKFRKECLEQLKNPEIIKNCWRSVWEKSGIGISDEKGFTKIFFDKIDQLLDSSDGEKVRISGDLIYMYWSFLDKRINYEKFELFFEKHLKWHHLAWMKKQEDKRYYQDGFSRIVNDGLFIIFKDILNRSIKENYLEVFLGIFEKHIIGHKDLFFVEKDNAKNYYIERLIDIYFDVFWRKIGYDIDGLYVSLKNYPESWKIKDENIKNNLIITECVFENVKKFVTRLNKDANSNSGLILRQIFEKLFPEFDTIVLADILIFALSDYQDADTKIRAAITELCKFGLFPDDEEIYDSAQKSQTIGANCKNQKIFTLISI